MFREILKMSFQSMRVNPLRTLLTMLGVIIGTAIVIVVLSIGAGVEALILSQLSSIKPESLYIEVQIPSEGTRQEKDAKTAEAVGSGVQITTLTLDDVKEVKEHYNISLGTAMSINQGNFIHEDTDKIATIFMVQEDYALMERLGFSEGRFFTESEEESMEQVVVLGKTVAEELFGMRSAVEQKVRLKGLTYEVVGVVEEVGTKFFLNMDEVVYMPVKTAQKKLLGIDYIQAISLQMESPELIATTIRDLENILRQNHRIQDPSKDDFVVRTMDQAMQIVGTVTMGISVLLFGIALISLVVGGVGIMNIMYVAVTERTREIGLRKAIGAEPWAIRAQFMMEAVLICFVGGLLGVFLGIAISWLTSLGAHAVGFEWPFIVKFGAVALAFGVSVVVGLAFGYAPARQASELDPILALRQ